MKSLLLLLSVTTLIGILAACQFGNPSGGDSITVFSERHYDSDHVLYDRFTDQTGIRVNIVHHSADPLLNRLENEGEDTIADVLIIADAGGLERAKNRHLLRPIESAFLTDVVPENLRDPDNHWFGMTMRARVFVYHPERVGASELSTYEALTEPAWHGRVITRSSENIYNQSLMASLIEIAGEAHARDFAEGLVNNFAVRLDGTTTPRGNDRAQAISVLAGEADLAIMNTYYIGVMLNSGDATQIEAAQTLEVFFPNQATTGTHVNASAVGVVKHTSNVEAATQFVEFLLSEEAQRHFTTSNYEYPVNPNVEWADLLNEWGAFNAQDMNLSALGKHNRRAKEIMDEAGWR